MPTCSGFSYNLTELTTTDENELGMVRDRLHFKLQYRGAKIMNARMPLLAALNHIAD